MTLAHAELSHRQGRPSNLDLDGVVAWEALLQVHLGYRPHADDIDYNLLSFETQSFSGAELANLVNNAAYTAARDDRDSVCMSDFIQVSRHHRHHTRLSPKIYAGLGAFRPAD